MPYVPISPVFRPKLTDSAEQRWQAIGQARPDLSPALALQRQLLTHVVELAAVLDGGRLPKLSLPPRYLAAKLARGVPALAGEPIPLPLPALTPTLLQLCDALASGGAGEAAQHIKDAIAGGTIDAGSLLASSLHRDQSAIRTGAAHRGLSPDLLWLVAELAVSPFVHALVRGVLGQSDPVLNSALAAWHYGYCPACGSWPALAEIVSTERVLRCSICAAGCEPKIHACIYCGERGDLKLVAMLAAVDAPVDLRFPAGGAERAAQHTFSRNDLGERRPGAAGGAVSVMPGGQGRVQDRVGLSQEASYERVHEGADRKLSHEPQQIGRKTAMNGAHSNRLLIAGQRRGHEGPGVQLIGLERRSDVLSRGPGTPACERVAQGQKRWPEHPYR